MARHRHPGMAGHAHAVLGERLALCCLLGSLHARMHRQRSPDIRDADRDGDERPEAAGEPALYVHC